MAVLLLGGFDQPKHIRWAASPFPAGPSRIGVDIVVLQRSGTHVPPVILRCQELRKGYVLLPDYDGTTIDRNISLRS